MANLPFYLARQGITVTPKQSYIDDFEEMCEALYENAPNYFADTDADAVQEETTFASRVFTPITCRVDSVVNPTTGKNVGDDYKNFILLPSASKVYVGKLFLWNNNYWLAINTNTYESVTNGCIARRCNNVLKWIDFNGVVQTEPCVIGYDILRPENFKTQEWIIAQGSEVVYCQKNLLTNQIQPNMRFLFGTEETITAWKVTGGGVKNYLNNATLDNYSPSIIELKIEVNFKNPQTDDFANGIADAYINQYQIIINQDAIQQNVGFTTTLTATVYKDGAVSTDSVLWSSSDVTKCTVSSGGVINLVALGTATITAKVANNQTIYATVGVTITATPVAEYDIRITPNINEIYEGDTQIFECKLYLNEVAQSDNIIFSILGSIPAYHYLFTPIDGQHFSIKNNRMKMGEALVIRATSGSNQADFSFALKGGF